MDDREKAAAELEEYPGNLDQYTFPNIFREDNCPKHLTPGEVYSVTAYRLPCGSAAIFFCCGQRIKRVGFWNPLISMPE